MPSLPAMRLFLFCPLLGLASLVLAYDPAEKSIAELAHPAASAGIDAWWVEPFRHGEFRMDYPFLDLPNVLGSPHNSPHAPGGDQVSAARACDNIARYLRGERPHGLIDPARTNMA